jgi:hypothetical protein
MDSEMKHAFLSLACVGLLGLLAVPSNAQVNVAPALLNYQGRIATSSGNPVPDGIYSIRFSLWDADTAGTEKWNQTISNVQVKNGTFAVLLNTNTAGLFNGNLWLETKIGNDTALTPRQQLVSVAYAMKANSVPDGSISAAQIANGSITGNKLAGSVLDSVWKLGGNSGASNTFLGTLDDNPLRFFTNWTHRMSLESNGNLILNPSTKIGLGTGIVPGARLDVRGNGGVHIFAGDGAPFGTAAIETNFNAPATHAWFAEGNNHVFSVTGGGQGYFAGNVGIGTSAPSEKLDVTGNAKFSGEVTANVVTVLGGSDVAEPYHVAPVHDVKPIAGMLVTIDPDKVGQMRVASRAYDSTVAGIISGANGINPGITLRQKGTVADGEFPVASIGRVWCWCDADASGEIKAGDLLTTSDTPGHAMKAADKERRDGAVIGKAMSSLKSGKGLVLVLVSLK